ncbi:MAG: ABC transporter ATP-binding protein [Anaerolineaceae bacterium]|nr:ABC transporter ATP-binding protein [Anaerolineaceae bacterium]
MNTAPKQMEFVLPEHHRTDHTHPVKWIYSHAKRYWYLILGGLIGSLLNAGLAGLTPVYTGQAFNLIQTDPGNIQQLGKIAILITITLTSRAISQYLRNLSLEITAQFIERNVRDELYSNMLGKSMTFHSMQPIGDIMAKATNDVREVNYFFSPGITMVMGSLVFLIIPIIYSPQYHPSLVIVPILFIIVYAWSIRHYLSRLGPATESVRANFGKLNTHLTESLDGIEIVKGAAREKEEITSFISNAHQYRNAMVKQGDVEAVYIPLLLMIIALSIGLGQSLYLYKIGLINMGAVVAYFGLLMMLDFPTFASLRAYSRISSGIASARRILGLMNMENNLDQNIHGVSRKMEGEVEFRDVSFQYGPELEPILHKISFHIKPGQRVAIVGQTGSGKTTLCRLINRTYDCKTGQVLVDGIDVRDWNLEALRHNISIIEQDIFLFSRSIRKNIAFGRPRATKEEIINAAQSAQADDFINSFPKKYETVIGERGVTLSGGQRQRLALARAFLTNPRILILDDSTSAIDSATEDRIQKAIFAAARGRTTFIITHRLSQIRWADMILVLKGGEIAAIGTHDELMQSSEPYRDIFKE